MKFEPGLAVVLTIVGSVMFGLIVGIIQETIDRRRKATPCGVCRGKGFLRVKHGVDWSDPNVKRAQIIDIECGACQGTGRLPYEARG